MDSTITKTKVAAKTITEPPLDTDDTERTSKVTNTIKAPHDEAQDATTIAVGSNHLLDLILTP
jgi:hypothetical protein